MFTSTARSDIAFEGDSQLAELLIAAQEANLTRYPAGRLTASYHEITPSSGEIEAKVELVWDEAKRFWNYDYRKRDDAEGEWSDWKRDIRRVIGDRDRGTYLAKDNRLILHKGTKTSSVPEYLEIVPASSWYRFQGVRTWKEMLSPDFGEGYVERVSVTMSEGNQVEFKRQYTAGDVLTVHCDLTVGGNVVAFHGTPAKRLLDPNAPNLECRGMYEWMPDGNGAFRLKSATALRFEPGNEEVPVMLHEMTIHGFDPKFEITDQQFTIVALGVPRGAQVDEYSPQHRSYFYGGKPSEREQTQRQLDQLIEKSRGTGFPKPESIEE